MEHLCRTERPEGIFGARRWWHCIGRLFRGPDAREGMERLRLSPPFADGNRFDRAHPPLSLSSSLMVTKGPMGSSRVGGWKPHPLAGEARRANMPFDRFLELASFSCPFGLLSFPRHGSISGCDPAPSDGGVVSSTIPSGLLMRPMGQVGVSCTGPGIYPIPVHTFQASQVSAWMHQHQPGDLPSLALLA